MRTCNEFLTIHTSGKLLDASYEKVLWLRFEVRNRAHVYRVYPFKAADDDECAQS